MINLKDINTYEDICVIDNVDPITSLPFQDPQSPEEIAVNNFAKAIRINRVLNDGWKPDWNNWDENKYYPWFDMQSEEAGSGSGFSFFDYCYVYVRSTVGSRLVYKSRELAEFVGKTFLDIYRGFMVI